MVLLLWIVSMIAALWLPRWATGLCVLVTIAADLLLCAHPITWPDWWYAGMLGATPWLLTGQRVRHTRRLTVLHKEERRETARLSVAAREVTALEASARHVESQITEITDVYHVTKETARAMHVEELFRACLGVAPRLLAAQGLRLIDCSTEVPSVLRARLAPDGRLLPAGGEADDRHKLLEVEGALVTRAAAVTRAEGFAAQRVAEPWPDGPAHAAWVPLWQERKSIGILVADELPDGQLKTLELVGHQLSLQLSRIALYRRVEALAVTDALTGVSVRRYFLERAREELVRATSHGSACTLLMVDLDLFKEKNDAYGHLVGDVVLREVARLLQRNLREIDLIARYGGEEFVLLLADTDAEHGLATAQRLRQLVEVHPIRAYDEVLTQTISIGLAGFPHDAQALDALIEAADAALYVAKRAGRNRVARHAQA